MILKNQSISEFDQNWGRPLLHLSKYDTLNYKNLKKYVVKMAILSPIAVDFRFFVPNGGFSPYFVSYLANLIFEFQKREFLGFQKSVWKSAIGYKKSKIKRNWVQCLHFKHRITQTIVSWPLWRLVTREKHSRARRRRRGRDLHRRLQN